MRQLIYLAALFVFLGSHAQEDAWVYFVDKQNVEASIANPLTILSQASVNRKNAKGISIDERDVPVNEAYISQIKTATGVSVMAKSKWLNAIHVRGEADDINALANAFAFINFIDFADDNLNTAGRISVENDKFSIENTTVSFNYGDTQNQVEMIGVDQLHLDNFTGDGIIIAVMDSGFPNVDTMGAFQRLRDNNDLLGGYDFVDRTENIFDFSANDHGTKVLSNMAGFIQDEFVGTAPDASYYVFRTEDVFSETPVEESYWVEAVERADSLGVDIINTSLGYRTYTNPNYTHTAADLDGSSTFITRGANIANDKGILVVTSAGNSGSSGVGAPADGTGVFSIGAVNANGEYASFSSQGSEAQATLKPDIVAQGQGAAVVDDSNSIVNNNGTSFSSPIMAGGLASLWQALPDATNEEIKQYAKASASQFNNPDFFLGFGIPNLANALNIGLSVQEETFEKVTIFPNPVRDILTIQIPSREALNELNIVDLTGKIVMSLVLNQNATELDISGLAKGIYILNIQSGNVSSAFKLIKS
ncbi:MAG: S8 family serine peptidase [Bacteroidota bacterium]